MRRVLYYEKKLTQNPPLQFSFTSSIAHSFYPKSSTNFFLQTRKQILIVLGIQIQIQTKNVIRQFIDEITIMNLGIKELNMNFIGEVSLIGRYKGIIIVFHIKRLNKR